MQFGVDGVRGSITWERLRGQLETRFTARTVAAARPAAIDLLRGAFTASTGLGPLIPAAVSLAATKHELTRLGAWVALATALAHAAFDPVAASQSDALARLVG